jgi:DMSO reductase family type II enzyme chaperone
MMPITHDLPETRDLPGAALARARLYASLSRLLASPREAVAEGWESPCEAARQLADAVDGLPFPLDATTRPAGSQPTTLEALRRLAGDGDPVRAAAAVAASHAALFEVGDRGPPLALREELAPGANPAAKEEVARFYEHFGYELGEDYAWRPDHVSVLLEFMHFLAWHEVQRASTGEAEDHGLAAGLRIAQRDFLRRHLAGWLPGVVAVAVVREDCVPLLAGTLAITADFIAADLAWLEADPTTDTQD